MILEILLMSLNIIEKKYSSFRYNFHYKVFLGADYIERHITLDRAMYGSDQSASLEPSGFRKLVRYIKEMDVAAGNGQIACQDEEIEVAKKLKVYSKCVQP